jgi:hypothetical protein
MALSLASLGVAFSGAAEARVCVIGPAYDDCIIGYYCFTDCCGPGDSCCYPECAPP